MVDAKAVAERLGALLRAQGVSYGEIAERAGVNKRTVWDIANGNRENPGVITLAQIATAMDVPVIALLDEQVFRSTMKTVLLRQYGDVFGTEDEHAASFSVAEEVLIAG